MFSLKLGGEGSSLCIISAKGKRWLWHLRYSLCNAADKGKSWLWHLRSNLCNAAAKGKSWLWYLRCGRFNFQCLKWLSTKEMGFGLRKIEE